ncbi:hypothetical protein F383_18440 [Gossypium arboreum]|uniref:Uncharacterized protein n=1 Tax=Gossypium arboreum TaxID=29729 RepID=A0A0B0MHM2_GOSAR|nr:hypothetical protein F383_18440 [Gossypium arboreum]
MTAKENLGRVGHMGVWAYTGRPLGCVNPFLLN